MKTQNLEKLIFEICKSHIDEKSQKAIIFMLTNGINIDKLLGEIND